MLEWPPDLDKPSPAHIFKCALELCGTDYWGCATARSIAAILIFDLHMDGKSGDDRMRWHAAETNAGERSGTFRHAHWRSKNRKVVRMMAATTMGTLIHKERRYSDGED